MNTFDSYVLLIIIALPMAGAMLLMAVPGSRLNTIRWVASVFALAGMSLSFYVFLAYYLDYRDVGGVQFERTWGWLSLPGFWPLGNQGISLTLGVDGISAPMVLLTGIVMFTGVLVSWTIRDRNKDFFILYFLLLSGVFGVFVVVDVSTSRPPPGMGNPMKF